MSQSQPDEGTLDPVVTIVTGAGRGIGAATVLRLARSTSRPAPSPMPTSGSSPTGARPHHQPPLHIMVNYVNDQASAERVVARARESGVGATTVRADVSREDDVLAMFAAADRIGPITGLVNNAGILYPLARLDSLHTARLERTWAVNITGPFLCAREAVKRMSTRYGGQGGAIVNLSSRAASLGSPNEFIDYAASKGAIDSMTVGLAAEVATEGIRVNAVRPGLIETDLHASSGQPDRVGRLASGVPMARGGTAGEVANLIVWLLSDEASYVTGALIDVGGGR